MRRMASGVTATMLTAVVVTGCERPRTELVVRVDSEVAWGPSATVQAVTLTVRRGGPAGVLRSQRTTTLGADDGRLPLPLLVGVLASDDDTETPVWLEALGCSDPNGCTPATAVVAQRAVVRFGLRQTVEVPLLLASACVNVVCRSDQRCEAGQCEAATTMPMGGVDAGARDAVADRPTVVDSGTTDLGSDASGMEAVTLDRPLHGWSQRFGLRRTASDVRVVVLDHDGNVYVGGQGAAGTSFGGEPIAAPLIGAFVASFAPDGRFRWFRQLGTDGRVDAIAADLEGNIYLAGVCQAAIDLGGGPMAGPASDTSGTFLGSLTTTGTHRWSRRFDGVSFSDLTVAGSSLMAGGFNGERGADFGNGTSSGTASEIFAASFSLAGTHAWTRHFGVTNAGPRIDANPSGTVCLTGTHQMPLDFGNGPIASDGTPQPFAACLAADGSLRWSRRFESDGPMAYSSDVAVDDFGNATITGLFERAIDFGGGARRSAGSYDVFVASFTPTGGHRWSLQFGGDGIDGSFALTVDGGGSVFVTGHFHNTVTFGGDTVTSAGQRDVFLASLSSSGVPQWLRRYGATEDDYGFSIDVNPANIALVGAFIGDVDFGGGGLSSVGSRDVFLLNLVR